MVILIKEEKMKLNKTQKNVLEKLYNAHETKMTLSHRTEIDQMMALSESHPSFCKVDTSRVSYSIPIYVLTVFNLNLIPEVL